MSPESSGAASQSRRAQANLVSCGACPTRSVEAYKRRSGSENPSVNPLRLARQYQTSRRGGQKHPKRGGHELPPKEKRGRLPTPPDQSVTVGPKVARPRTHTASFSSACHYQGGNAPPIKPKIAANLMAREDLTESPGKGPRRHLKQESLNSSKR